MTGVGIEPETVGWRGEHWTTAPAQRCRTTLLALVHTTTRHSHIQRTPASHSDPSETPLYGHATPFATSWLSVPHTQTPTGPTSHTPGTDLRLVGGKCMTPAQLAFCDCTGFFPVFQNHFLSTVCTSKYHLRSCRERGRNRTFRENAYFPVCGVPDLSFHMEMLSVRLCPASAVSISYGGALDSS